MMGRITNTKNAGENFFISRGATTTYDDVGLLGGLMNLKSGGSSSSSSRSLATDTA